MGTTKSSASLLFLLLLLLAHSASAALDINAVLSPYPDFKDFKDLLTKTNLVASINSQSAVTLLVVDSASVASISTLPTHFAQDVLSMHVLLGYYDANKLKSLTQELTSVPTLFQSSSHAAAKAAVMNITSDDGQVQFGSSTAGSQLNSDFVKEVVSKPSTIAVLQVKNLILPPGLDEEIESGMSGSSSSPSGSAGYSSTPTPATPAASGSTPPPTTTTPGASAPPKASTTTPAAAPPKAAATTTPATSPPKSSTTPAGTPPKAITTPASAPPKAITTPASAPPKAAATTPSAATTPAGSAETPAKAAAPTAGEAPVTADSPVSATAEAPAGSTDKEADAGAPSGVGKLVVGGGVGVVVMAAAALFGM